MIGGDAGAVMNTGDFIIKDFVDEFLSSGLVPIPLIRWEMTGNSDDIFLETQGL